MVEPRRLESPPHEAADRDSRTERLLVDGLDQYFAGRYEDAIHLWTRVLFLDRSHARARAYIDRARSALSERQRRAEEMLQASQALLAEGQTAAARELLTRAVAATGDDDRVTELRSRLERLERARVGQGEAPRMAVVDVVPVTRGVRSATLALIATSAVAASIIAFAVMSGRTAGEWTGTEGTQELPGVTRPATLPVLSTSDAAMVRARTLYSRGRLAEALRALDRVDPQGALRADADRLKAEIQQLLLATRSGSSIAAPQRGLP